jgi:hypothetical protein
LRIISIICFCHSSTEYSADFIDVSESSTTGSILKILSLVLQYDFIIFLSILEGFFVTIDSMKTVNPRYEANLLLVGSYMNNEYFLNDDLKDLSLQ